jgi:hypothetical protein
VSWRGSPPSTGRSQIWGSGLGGSAVVLAPFPSLPVAEGSGAAGTIGARVETKARVRPSGDQRGDEIAGGAAVSCRGAPPSIGTSQTPTGSRRPLCRGGSRRRLRGSRPGEGRGSPTMGMAKRSSAVMGRLASVDVAEDVEAAARGDNETSLSGGRPHPLPPLRRSGESGRTWAPKHSQDRGKPTLQVVRTDPLSRLRARARSVRRMRRCPLVPAESPSSTARLRP